MLISLKKRLILWPKALSKASVSESPGSEGRGERKKGGLLCCALNGFTRRNKPSMLLKSNVDDLCPLSPKSIEKREDDDPDCDQVSINFGTYSILNYCNVRDSIMGTDYPGVLCKPRT